MNHDLESTIFVVIADISIDVFTKTNFSNSIDGANHVKNMLQRNRPDLVDNYITAIYQRVNKIYDFTLEKMVEIIGRFFEENHYHDYYPALQGIRRCFGPYINLTH